MRAPGGGGVTIVNDAAAANPLVLATTTASVWPAEGAARYVPSGPMIPGPITDQPTPLSNEPAVATRNRIVLPAKTRADEGTTVTCGASCGVVGGGAGFGDGAPVSADTAKAAATPTTASGRVKNRLRLRARTRARSARKRRRCRERRF